MILFRTHGDGLTEETVAPGFKVIARSGQLVAGFIMHYFYLLQ
jgi:hypothetical protein